MLAPGQTVAGYRVERVLGVGGMGVVYLVANPELPRRDALKVLSAELSQDADFRARFTREAEVASMLDHPNITSIYRRGTTEDGQLWIAMQFIDGTDADAALRAGTMTPHRAVHIVTEVGKALDYAHQRNVVHRDVKPANFLLSGPVGPNERVLLCDFGIARALDDAGITVTGSVTATVAYAAPEVLTGRAVDGRSDIYSLGCALFRLLTGKPPYHDSASAAAVMNAHLRQDPPRVTDLVPGLPRALDAVIARAMAKDPAKRYRSAADFSGAAVAALDERTVPAPQRRFTPAAPVPPPGQAPPPAQTVPPPSAPAPPPGGWAPHYPQYQPAPAAPVRRGWVLGAIAGVVVLVAAGIVGITALSDRGGADAPPPTATTSATSPSATTTTTTTTRPPGPPVAASALAGLLISPEELANLAGAAGITVTASAPMLSDDSGAVDRKDCVGAWVPVQRTVYGEQGWNAAEQQMSRSANEGPPSHTVTQAVVSFADAAAAEASVGQQSEQWSGCAGQVITATMPDSSETVRYTLGSPSTEDGVVRMRETREGGNGWGCERAIGARNNVVADTMVCRYDPAGQAVAIARAILDRVPA
ncbi:serine/threonine-protein kinase PknH/PknJ [[Mycobacterium] wendilense]|uniref:non-specific serine/threonine protein kinase n=1 Tax=[Mycobacterium] wendilense TaxID=3064284 RepID=A0ABN9NWI7_9MYCO|nr:serine/threonine-protein kinase PknH/PknJ [Mycolicibacterium sp. MU0050]CAJ1578369.1 serine/threonine-protein kinase PknH/PknJ [Mycolicibacterium sp. MU0050]